MAYLTRRAGVGLAFALALASSVPAMAQEWPARPVTLIVPFAAGGGTDAFARPLAAQLDAQMNQRFLIENRAGAGGTAGASLASRATPDGYAFLVGAAHHTIAPSLYPRLDYNIETDFIPVAMIARPPHVVVVNPTRIQARTLAEFIAHARANPDRLTYGSAGNGTTHHLAGELFKILTGTRIQHVPYRGAGPAMQDLVAGQIDVMFDGLGTAAGQITGGQIRALAVSATERNPAIPDVPTAQQAGVDNYDVSTWYAIWAPRNTPAPVIARFQAEIRRALQAPAIVEAWRRQGSDIPQMEGEAFGRFVSEQVQRWRRVVTDANVRLEGG
jgi:tripartite-type tricarboxylate transporter receptor subunit TctC